MTSTITLTLVDGVRIVVPDSLDLITPYVLQEQQDWFEDEIKFVRFLLTRFHRGFAAGLLARDKREFRVADGDRIQAASEGWHFARSEQADFLVAV